MSGKNEGFLKCQGNVREFYDFQFFVSNDEKQNMTGSFLNILDTS